MSQPTLVATPDPQPRPGRFWPDSEIQDMLRAQERAIVACFRDLGESPARPLPASPARPS